MKHAVRFALFAALCVPGIRARNAALRVGHLVDPETGTAAANQMVLVENGKFSAIGGNVAIPAGGPRVARVRRRVVLWPMLGTRILCNLSRIRQYHS